MHPNDTKKVLAAAAAYDNRVGDPAVVIAWSEALGDISRDDAIRAVVEHARTAPGVYLTVAHVIAIVKRHRRTGLDQAPRLEAVMLRNVDPDDPTAVINTIHQARAIAARGGAAVPSAAQAITSRYAPAEGQRDVNARGRAALDAILAAHPNPAAGRADATAGGRQPTSANLAAQDRAAMERARIRRRRLTEPTQLNRGDLRRATTSEGARS